jgi:hypothetical protein
LAFSSNERTITILQIRVDETKASFRAIDGGVAREALLTWTCS